MSSATTLADLARLLEADRVRRVEQKLDDEEAAREADR